MKNKTSRPGSGRTFMLQVRLTEAEWSALEVWSREHDVSKSWIARKAISRALAGELELWKEAAK